MPIMTPPIKENAKHDSDLDAESEGEDGGPHIKKKVLRSAKKLTKEKEVTEIQDDVEDEVVGEKGDEQGTSRVVRNASSLTQVTRESGGQEWSRRRYDQIALPSKNLSTLRISGRNQAAIE